MTRYLLASVFPADHFAAGGSNVFMTMAWYGHLKNLATAPWYLAALVSWGIALAEYLLQVPANRIGFQQAGYSASASSRSCRK